MLVPIDLAGRSCSGSLCHRTPLGVPCVEIDESGDSQSYTRMFLFGRLVSERERFESLLVVNTMEHAFSFHGASGKCH
jgi:hypothetical protein